MSDARSDFDVLIVGAGPAGLALAKSLAGCNARVALIERAPRAALEQPAYDGREIALTQRSVDRLQTLDAWRRIAEEDISPLGEARVFNGRSARSLNFQPPRDRSAETLGHLVPNHAIRRALFESVMDCPGVELFAGSPASGIETNPRGAAITLEDGTRLTGRLAVAADTRFSDMRRRMGIAASMRDFGKTMLVCRMAHDRPHHAVATEWFGHGQTIAMLPLRDNEHGEHVSSLVLTLPARETERLMALEEGAFGAEIARRFDHRLGFMRLLATRHAYPLVAVYAARFVAERFALAGDAAVGMHPVTAHGFNFGLIGEQILSGLVTGAMAGGSDIGAASLLRRYEMTHRRATRPLYLTTNATATLFVDDRIPARALRDLVIRVGEKLPPIRRAVAEKLMEGAGRPRRPSLLRALVP